MAFENYQDMRVGDVIECYRVEQVQRSSVSPSLTASMFAYHHRAMRARLCTESPAIHLQRRIFYEDDGCRS